jgi:RsiW-degrading membrane proteinase PrsW (M82 family)
MNVAEVIDWSLALVPVLVMAALFTWLDIFKLMSVWEMLGLVIVGGIAALAAWPISGQMLDALPMGFSFYSRNVAPWIEEALKGVAIVLLFASNRIGYKLDAVISGFTIGAGFSVIENIFYLSRYPELTAPVWMVRGLGTAIMHGTTTAILAAVAHELGERSTRRNGGRFWLNPLWFIPGYIAAGLIHMLFNHFPEQPMPVMFVTLVTAPLVLLGVLRFGEGEAKGWLAQEAAAHEAALAEWRAGGFPKDASGQRIEALARRSAGTQAERIHAYCTLKTELVLAAERELQDKDRLVEPEERYRLRRQFAELEGLRKAMGRTGFAALQPLLPFSRNDDWELSELREVVGRD